MKCEYDNDGTRAQAHITRFEDETEHDGKRMLLVGQWQDLAAYYRADNGEAWTYNNCTRSWSNSGDYAGFVETFKDRKRGSLWGVV